MSLSPIEATYSVAELCGEIRSFLGEAFASVWVAGEVQRVRPSSRGHLYFELVEKGADDSIVGKLDAVLWRTDHQRVRRMLAASGQEIAAGQSIRCYGGVDFYGPAGRLQLIVREVDPVFSLGLLEKHRRETLGALAKAGLLEKNRALPLPAVPLTVGLVTSADGAAYHDFLDALTASGYGFRVLFVHAAVQGRGAEKGIASALAALAGSGVDCAALIRGGGSRTDLAVFDTREVAEAVARAPFPVLTGLGHQIDESIADRVAHRALSTPTKVAEMLVERVAAAEGAVRRVAGDLRRLAERRLARGRAEVGASERGFRMAGLRLAAAHRRLGELAVSFSRASRGRLAGAEAARRGLALRLSRGTVRAFERRRGRPEALARRVATGARGRLREARATLEGVARLCADLSPRRTLERGFTITHTAAGVLVRSPAAAAPGERLETETAGGVLNSIVEGT